MNLSQDYTYLFLDFETTGLDVSQDFPIQIAMILVDHHFRILKSYNSYISVPDSVLNLKSNVSYMTGIDLDTIKSQGQEIALIQNQIAEFFGEKTIIIGQNIAFDIWFLKKFFPDCKFADSLDSYPLAASMIPYLKSYSLESIDKHLENKYSEYNDKKSYLLTSLSSEKELSSHDALYDCIVGLCFIHRRIDQYDNFIKEFPFISSIHNNYLWNDFSIFHIITTTKWKKTTTDTNIISFPTLSSPIKSEKKSHHITSNNRENAPQHSKRSTKDIELQRIINELPQPCIIAVSHASKIDIIKRACLNESFNYLKEEQILDHKKLHSRLQKTERTTDEFLFIIFYLSHHRDWYRVLNPILSTHKYILDYLQDNKFTVWSNKKILCSHGGLYYTMSNKEYRDTNFSKYPICILDADRRHTTYNDFAQKWIQLISTLSQREKVWYTLQQEKTPEEQKIFEELIKYRELFIAYFWIESDRYLNGINKIEINYIIHHEAYKKSLWIRNTIISEWKLYTINYGDIPLLSTMIKKIHGLFHNPIIIRRVVSHTNDVSYTLAPSVRYIDFAEYLKLFGNQKLFFFSSSRSEYKIRLPAKIQENNITIQNTDNINNILSIIKEKSGSLFIISHNSEKSKKLFQAIHEAGYGKTHKLIGEYLTWWIGKNTSLVESGKNNIIIWGYHMLLQLRWQGKYIDHIILYTLHKNMSSFIMDDIKQYMITS